MKSLFSGIILTLALSLGLTSIASATSDSYYQTGPTFSQAAYMTSYTYETDSFYFTNYEADGSYHFYSTGPLDLVGSIWSDTYMMELAYNDDNLYGYDTNFCVDAYLFYGEAITVNVQGFSGYEEGSYNVVGAPGSCMDDPNTNTAGIYDPGYTDPGYTDPGYTDPNNGEATIEIAAVSLPVVLFSVLGLAAVRLRRFFA